ncbi:tRNA lysidine(34) synthetase TilS [Aequorivita lipolytica]|uniref:tRNA(Ile)-lysidine synthase n=1 Tax=Aequorivita lipolytica TaxID=153267 RepID=A0A5C6YQI8_9FLAO|nr:tRNA lysidine(34) synthetase TilS [Aequorivita lipolytica]TXD69615.1 tRNA lysidine(34) synthetase TilS [Aequorivita lipolytica]SRX51104.1 tRNA(Ile)-lysidine synthase [Aequorivita lipolytica]
MKLQALFEKNIKINFPFLIGEKLLIACSGGLDSVVLTHLMKQLECEIALAHCNFSLRGKESDGDEMFVIGLAKSLEIPVFAETFDTKKFAEEHKISTQMAARDLRYNWFAEILKDFKYDYLLTAHHLDDDLETFFINLTRGTGLNGLTGIPKENNKIIRPLLKFSRQEILQYAETNNFKWREDSSNQKTDYLRNKLRLEVLPKFKETNESILKNFQKTQQNLQASQNLIDDYMGLVFKLVISGGSNSYKINIQKLKELPNTDALLYELLHGFGFTEWDDVSNLLDAQTGKMVFSKTHQLLKNRDELILTEISDENISEEFLVPKTGITSPINLKIETSKYIGETEKNLIYIASEKLKFPLKLRKWRSGDSFQPFGMKGKKKLSKFFKDEKIPLTEKEKIWLLLIDDQVVWVIGHRMDDRFKVTENTSEILKISYLKNN